MSSNEQEIESAKAAVMAATHASEWQNTDEPFSIFTIREKRLIACVVSIGAFFSPLSGNIYLPALPIIAKDLHVSLTLVNFSLTSYMVVQGIAPTIIASYSDSAGRRPAYLVCFTLYLAANIGLAVQNNYATLIVLRCLQSAGSSATMALANGVIADIVTTAERGTYMGYTFSGAFVAQSLGPVLGGILAQFLTWHWIFWFLTIFAGVFLFVYLAFVPETCRNLVGNGSTQYRSWSDPLIIRYHRRRTNSGTVTAPDPEKSRPSISLPNPLTSLKVCLERSPAILLLHGGLVFSCIAAIVAALPARFQLQFDFNELQIGLSQIPMGVGSCLAALVSGRLADLNYKRHASKHNLPVDKKRQREFGIFPIEKARLEVALPFAAAFTLCIIAYGWILQYAHSLPGALVILFFIGFTGSGAFSVFSTLLVDVYSHSPSTAGAANNLVRCLLGAGTSAFILPLIDKIGSGWSYTFIGALLIVFCPLPLLVLHRGVEWRNSKKTADVHG